MELTEVGGSEAPRMLTGIGEIDRVLGGGVVPGSVILLAGEPGVGKSTLLMHIAGAVARHHGPVLYATGEESPAQVRMRAERLGVDGTGVFLLATGDLESVLHDLEARRPRLVLVDSIQTLASPELPGTAGSVSQVRDCARQIVAWAKESGVPAILAGHVTKDGSVAGPRVLEHAVDVVLYLDADGGGALRTLHGVKNRFGHTDEIGVFEMGAGGMAQVPDPSRTLLGDRAKRSGGAPGSAVAALIEGTRPLVVEVQALTSPAPGPSPRRSATGFDPGRLNQVVAVLARRLGLPLAAQDVIVSVAGGLRLTDTGADLPVALAIASSLLDVPVDGALAAAGEIGLAGELRPVAQAARRRAEAQRLGFRGCVMPPSQGVDDLDEQAPTLADAVRVALPGTRIGVNYGATGVVTGDRG